MGPGGPHRGLRGGETRARIFRAWRIGRHGLSWMCGGISSASDETPGEEMLEGHLLREFLALRIRMAIEQCLQSLGGVSSWPEVVEALLAVHFAVVVQEGVAFRMRSPADRLAGQIFKGVGVALPPRVQELNGAESAGLVLDGAAGHPN